MEAININPDQMREQSELGLYCSQYLLPEVKSRREDRTTKVVIGEKRSHPLYVNYLCMLQYLLMAVLSTKLI